MANQKITSLNELFAITASLDDLTVVVDVDDFSSPTGETKKMTLGELSKFALSTATLVSGSSQIFFSGLGDVSGSISGSPNYFIKVNANGTGVTYHESVETVEETIFQESSSFQVGQTVRRISGSYVTGSYNSETEASVVGVVRRVLSGSLSGSQIFTIVYSGRINFSQNPVDHTSGLNDGQVYYVGETGSLHDVNPNTCDHNLVGRPVLVSTGISGGFSTGIVFNSSANSGNEETQVQTFYQVAHGFTIGDAVRKTTTSGVWAFATADTAVNSEALGIVDSCPDSDHFSIVTHGLITSLNGLMEGSVYFLATSSLGSAPFRNIGLTEPLTLISKPMYVAVSTSSAIVVNYRGSEALSGGGGGGGTGVSQDITQVAHGFSLGDVIKRTSGSWVISTADNDINAESLGVISVVADANNFTVIFDGLIDTLSGLMDGQVYFLATSSTGPVPLRNVTLTEPLTPYVSKPIYVATSPSSAIITSYRGVIIASGSTELSGSALFISGSQTSRFIGNVEITGSLVITSSATFRNIGMTILEGPTTASIISASFFIGDGSGLTGVATGSSSPGTISSSLQFTNVDDVTFRNITASNITASALFISGSETSRFIGNVEVTGSLTVTSSATFKNIGMTILEGPTTASIVSASLFIGELSQPSTLEIYIDPVNGTDLPGYGTSVRPYKTINYGMTQVSTVPATIAGQVQWCNEKLVFILANGVYSENVITRWKRARVALQSFGAKISGSITHQALLVDFPFGGVTGPGFYQVANNPSPWSAGGPFQSFELIGEGSGMESGFTSMGLMVTGQVTMDYEDNIGTGATGWQGRFFNSYFLCNHTQLLNGVNLVSYNNQIGLTMEIDGSSIQGGSLGILPRTGSLIQIASNPMGISLKAHNSQLKSTIGAGISILEIDGCRVVSMDRTTGGVTDGYIVGTNGNTSYSGIVNCAFAGSTYKIGYESVATPSFFTFDANSLNHFKTGHTIDTGSGSVTYVLQDDCTYVKYPPASSSNWSVVPTQVAGALDELAARTTASYVDFSNVANKPTLVSSSLQFGSSDDVTFRNITASNITASALFISGSTTSRFIGNVEVTGSLTVTSSATFRNIGMTILEGPTTASIISASVFIGDGSQLTGVAGSSPGTISSSLQFTNTDDVRFRNITASRISASIFIGDTSLTTTSPITISSSDIDWNSGSVFTKTLSANTTFTFSNIQPKVIVVLVTNSGSFTATWPTTHWPAGIAPTLTTGSVTDVFTFVSLGQSSTTASMFGAVQKDTTLIGDGSALTGVISSSYSVSSSFANSVPFTNVTGKPTLISSSLQFTNTSDVTFRNVTASVVSASSVRGTDLLNTPPVVVSSTNIDWSSGSIFTKTITGSTTFTFSNIQPKVIAVLVTNSGSFNATWPTVHWPAGVVPTLTTGSGTDIFNFISLDESATTSSIYGAVQKDTTLIGDGSGLTGVISSSYSISSSRSNLSDTASYVTVSQTASLANSVAYTNITGKPSLVSSSLQFTNTDDVTFRNITASNITASALFISGSQTSIFIGNVEITGSLVITSSATFRNIGMTILEGPTTASIISASVFIGDGSQLTGTGGGLVRQVLTAEYAAYIETNLLIPVDDTPPLISEGVELLSLSITPSSTSNRIRVDVSVPQAASDAVVSAMIALFRGSTCIDMGLVTISTNGYRATLSLSLVDSPATTSPVVYSVRFGCGNAGVISINGHGGVRVFGGTSKAAIILTEIGT